MDNIRIRPMKIDDIPHVLAIEKEAFRDHWKEDIYVRELLENNFSHYYVLEKADMIIGFCGMWVVLDDAQITNFAIHSSHRKHGYGQKLFLFMMKTAIQMQAKQLSLEVRVSNVGAQHLYRKCGLLAGGIRKNYYQNDGEDAMVMWVNLI